VRVGILGWMECGFGDGLVHYTWLDIGSQQKAVTRAYTNAFSSGNKNKFTMFPMFRPIT
jgi:hypothetical protein